MFLEDYGFVCKTFVLGQDISSHTLDQHLEKLCKCKYVGWFPFGLAVLNNGDMLFSFTIRVNYQYQRWSVELTKDYYNDHQDAINLFFKECSSDYQIRAIQDIEWKPSHFYRAVKGKVIIEGGQDVS